MLIHPDGRRALIPAGDEPRAAREDVLLLVRNRPISVPLRLAGATSHDHLPVSASGELLVRWHADEADLAALRHWLGSAGELRLQDLAEAVAHGGALSALFAGKRTETADGGRSGGD